MEATGYYQGYIYHIFVGGGLMVRDISVLGRTSQLLVIEMILCV